MDRILRRREVSEKTGLSTVTIWRKCKAGEFPQPIQLSSNAIGWWESRVDKWLAERRQVAYGQNK